MDILEVLWTFLISPPALLLSFSGFVGKILVNSFVTVFQFAFGIVHALFYAHQVIWRDYLVFIVDVSEKCGDFSQWVGSLWSFTTTATFDGISALLGVVNTLLILPLQSSCFFIKDVFYQLYNVCMLIAGALEFIGSSVLWTLFTFPVIILNQISVTPRLIISFTISYIFKFKEFCAEAFIQLKRELETVSLSSSVAYMAGATFVCIFFMYSDCIATWCLRTTRRTFVIMCRLIRQCWSGEFFDGRQGHLNQNNPFLADEDEGNEVSNENSRLSMCVVCLSEPKNILFLPCRHVTVCRSCVNLLPASVCPLCRKRIRRTMEVFV